MAELNSRSWKVVEIPSSSIANEITPVPVERDT